MGSPAESGLPGQHAQEMGVVARARGQALLVTSPSFKRYEHFLFPRFLLRQGLGGQKVEDTFNPHRPSEGKVLRSPLFLHARIGSQESKQNANGGLETKRRPWRDTFLGLVGRYSCHSNPQGVLSFSPPILSFPGPGAACFNFSNPVTWVIVNPDGFC